MNLQYPLLRSSDVDGSNETLGARATASKKVDSLNGKEEKFESSFSRKDTRNW
jgi:hypothetical protein